MKHPPAAHQVAGFFDAPGRLESALADLSGKYDLHHAVTWPTLAYRTVNLNQGE
ncbi:MULTISPECIES: hypothetical protein [Methylococcus]|uniref:Uncharacterized protein n=1 Tax=Methylococcus capsulatus TaxID=414 RepID=A0ABZ2F532_METCP|nr:MULTISPECIES: hypothetical protein [Methylococcus]